MPDKVNIRFYKKGDESPANDFHNRELGVSRTIDQWIWEFLSYSHDNPPFIIAEMNNEIVGTQALIPIVLIENGKLFLSAKSEETLVAPKCRGKGLFNKMYEPLLEWCLHNETKVIWGYTFQDKVFKVMMKFAVPGSNEQFLLILKPHQAYRSLVDRYPDLIQASSTFKSIQNRSLLYPTMHGLNIWERVLRMIRSKHLRHGGCGFRVENVEKPDQRFNELSVKFSLQYPGITIHRSDEYLKWRIFSNPGQEYKVFAAVNDMDEQLLGYSVCSIDRNTHEGYIVDLIAIGSTDSLVALSLLAHATNYLARNGCISVRGWRVSEHPFDKILSKQYPKLGFFHIRKGAPIVIRPVPKDDNALKYENIDNWYMSRIFTQGVSS